MGLFIKSMMHFVWNRIIFQMLLTQRVLKNQFLIQIKILFQRQCINFIRRKMKYE